MASPVRAILRRTEAAERPRPPADLSEDLLEEIFFRISSPADLARASTACASFRRLVADPSFLRRYRSLHPPVLIGFLWGRHGSFAGPNFEPAEAPLPGASAARALETAADFSFNDYLPHRPNRWKPCDVRDGRVLLEHIHDTVDDDDDFRDLAVCDPLSRKYLLLPPIPDDQLHSVHGQDEDVLYIRSYLLPCTDEEDETSFRVISMTRCVTNLAVFVFFSGSGLWSMGTSTTWDALSFKSPPEIGTIDGAQCVSGCFYWDVEDMTQLIKLDITRMQFSAFELPPHGHFNTAVVDAGEGRLGMLSYQDDSASVEYYTIMQNENKRDRWRMESIVPVRPDLNFLFHDAPEGYISLVGTSRSFDKYVAECFSLEIRTLKIEWVCTIRNPNYCVYAYVGYPPFMSPTRI